MKKLSISLFAVLAIIFAVSSAFTTAKKNTGTTTRWVYLENFVAFDVFEVSHETGAFDEVETYQDAAIPFAGTPDELICDAGDEDLVCAISFEDDDVNGVPGVIDEAELPASATAATIAYKEL